jgi:hypothetical protein
MALGDEAFTAAHRADLQMSIEQAVAMAKARSRPPVTPAKPQARR